MKQKTSDDTYDDGEGDAAQERRRDDALRRARSRCRQESTEALE
jgi:hypothetical protein